VAIAHIGTDSKGSLASPATLNVTKPTGITPGSTDRLVLVTGCGDPSAAGSYTAPAGWTSIGSVLNAGTASQHISVQAWHAAGDVANLAFTKSGSATDVGWVMLCFSGVDTTTPIDATGTANSNTGAATLTTNAVTIATDQAWHCIAFADWLSGTFSATGFTNAESPLTNESAALLYNTTPKSTGSTGTVVVTSSAASSGQVLAGVPFALRPVVGAAPTLDQYGWRFRNDDGSETTATWIAAENTNITVPLGSIVRPRFGVNATGDPTSQAPELDARITPAATGIPGAWKRARPVP
jgi:hypothetical protein